MNVRDEKLETELAETKRKLAHAEANLHIAYNMLKRIENHISSGYLTRRFAKIALELIERPALWMPIETAPKDGRNIHLGFYQHHSWCQGIGYWDDGTWRPDLKPTHWYPMLPGPEVQP